MARSDQLRTNKEQHKPKNKESKADDKRIFQAMRLCVHYLEQRFAGKIDDYEFIFEKVISFEILIKLIRNQGVRKAFDPVFNKRTIKPDGGVIYLKKKDDPNYLKIVLISEVKKQGTNKERIAEGKKRQAQGNAIERLSKNLTGIRAALNHEPITPFVCFGWGCDFEEDYDHSSFVMSKVSMMNEFYDLNKIYVFKTDGNADKNRFAPVSMFFREEEWTVKEMQTVLNEVGETALRYYIY